MNTPNFFILGAPKCGTTSLHNYLNQHPDIYMSYKKEPHYFCYNEINFNGPGDMASANEAMVLDPINYFNFA